MPTIQSGSKASIKSTNQSGPKASVMPTIQSGSKASIKSGSKASVKSSLSQVWLESLSLQISLARKPQSCPQLSLARKPQSCPSLSLARKPHALHSVWPESLMPFTQSGPKASVKSQVWLNISLLLILHGILLPFGSDPLIAHLYLMVFPAAVITFPNPGAFSDHVVLCSTPMTYARWQLHWTWAISRPWRVLLH
jgi:hypothetical protein